MTHRRTKTVLFEEVEEIEVEVPPETDGEAEEQPEPEIKVVSSVKLVVGESSARIGLLRSLLAGSVEDWLSVRRATLFGNGQDAASGNDADDETGDEKATDELLGEIERGSTSVGRLAGMTFLADAIGARMLYPDLVSSVIEHEGFIRGQPFDLENMSVVDFLALPQPLTDSWQDAVYELNPQWSPTPSADEKSEGEKAAEKKG